jgi:predicted RNase H-like HicB family nuclease
MKTKLTLVYWKSAHFWLGKLLEYPEIMTQGETLEELEENIRDAYRLMVLDDVPEKYQTKTITL